MANWTKLVLAMERRASGPATMLHVSAGTGESLL